jgi:hypothetical protein
VFINPTSPFSIFGIVFNLSHGMVPLVYVIGLGAMLFTAGSYVMMSRAFPVGGARCIRTPRTASAPRPASSPAGRCCSTTCSCRR